MIAFPAGVKVWIAGGVTDMRCCMNSLALKVQQGLGRDPHGGEVFCFRGRKGDLIKVLWHDGVGMSLYLKRLEAGKSIWPVSRMALPCPYRQRSSAIYWKGSTGVTRAGRNGLRRQADRFLYTVCWAFGTRHGSFLPLMTLLRRSPDCVPPLPRPISRRCAPS
ncbi:IS66 family insertion sequence element accessory protein TnpB [Shinella sp.]|uniref:IS66 family insertion sequence element accessory protein TnpB n=1 Tax=Shinella sp. TaxID=1870904 RepID=UPI003917BB21